MSDQYAHSERGIVNFDTGEVKKLQNAVPDDPDIRFNDGRCDRRGRFWAGTLHEKRQIGAGALYRLDPDGACHKMLGGITVSNGLTWSPDDRTMYFADSHVRTIFSFDFDTDSGTPRNHRVFAELAWAYRGFLTEQRWTPKGSCGAPISTVGALPALHPTGAWIEQFGCPFSAQPVVSLGGNSLDILYVTSASSGLTDEQKAESPLAGGIFALDVGVKGLPEPRFAG